MSGSDEMAQAIAQFNDMLLPIMEASVGHRAEAIRLGFTEEAASRMGAAYHEVLMAILKNRAFGTPR